MPLKEDENFTRHTYFLVVYQSRSTTNNRYARNIQDLDNEIYLSVVSTWEAIVKYQLGKLPLLESPEIYFPKHCDRHQILNLDLDRASVTQLSKLPSLHRDPFDRMLICQAIQNNMVIATVDEAVRAYPVNLLKP